MPVLALENLLRRDRPAAILRPATGGLPGPTRLHSQVDLHALYGRSGPRTGPRGDHVKRIIPPGAPTPSRAAGLRTVGISRGIAYTARPRPDRARLMVGAATAGRDRGPPHGLPLIPVPTTMEGHLPGADASKTPAPAFPFTAPARVGGGTRCWSPWRASAGIGSSARSLDDGGRRGVRQETREGCSACRIPAVRTWRGLGGARPYRALLPLSAADDRSAGASISASAGLKTAVLTSPAPPLRTTTRRLTSAAWLSRTPSSRRSRSSAAAGPWPRPGPSGRSWWAGGVGANLRLASPACRDPRPTGGGFRACSFSAPASSCHRQKRPR